MNWFRNAQLKHKLIAFTVLISGVALSIGCGGFALYEHATFRRTLVRDFGIIANILDDNIAPGLAFSDTTAMEQTLVGLKAHRRVVAAGVYDKTGKLVARYQRSDQQGHFPFPASARTSHQFAPDRLDTFQDIILAGEWIGVVYIGSDLVELTARTWRYAATVSALLMACSLVALVLASRLQKLIFGPIVELAQIAATVAAEKNYAIRAHQRGHDEVGRLIDSFNDMLGQIQARDAELQAARATLEQRVEERTHSLKQAQAAAELERARFQFIFEAIPVGVSLVTLRRDKSQERITNDAHVRICGLTREETNDPENFARISDPAERVKQMELKRQLDAGEIDQFTMEKRYLRPDGKTTWVVFSAQSRRYDDGTFEDLTTIVDVTELKLAQEAAAREQARFRLIFESVPVGLTWMTLGDLSSRMVNPAHAAITGVPVARCRELALYRLATPVEDRERQDELHRRLLAGEIERYDIEKRYRHPDGSERWAALTVHLLRHAPDEVHEINSVVDITERKHAEAKLAEASGLLEAMLENSPDAIYFKDRESRFVRFSRAVAQRFDEKDADWLVGKTDADLFSPEHALPAYRDEQEIMRTGVPIIGQLEKETHADHPATWALTTKMPWRDGTGKIIGTFGISKDVTALKQTEDKLAHERDLLRTLMDSIPDTIYFKDTQSRFVMVSRSKVKKTLDRLPDLRARRAAKGLAADVPEPELLTGLTDYDTYQNEDARLAFEDEQQIINSGEAMLGKLEKQVYLDGTLRWSLTSKMPWRDPEGKIIGTFGISKDITDLKEAERKVEDMHRQLMDTSRQAGMAEVATGVLHNVGNVLNSVNVSATLVADQVRRSKAGNVVKLSALFEQHKANLADFLTQDPRGRMIPGYLGTLAESLAEEQKSLVAEMENLRKNIDHIKEIVSMQQAYARTSGVIETISVPDLIEDALRINAGSLARHDVDAVRDYQARPVVTTDKHKVMQILINLVRNAKYACDESGRTDKRIIVRTTSDEHSVKIAVIDNGIGIPAENLTRIFNHGFTTRATGHGFGLHSGALAAKELRGSLSVESAGPGHGATFILELPFKPEGSAHEKSRV